jgi:para-aminobenzoate synthetase component 1
MTIFVCDYHHTDAPRIFAKIQNMPYSLFFDSADRDHPDARYSYILANPLETIEAKGTDVTISSREKLKTVRGKNPFDVLKACLEAHEFDKKKRDDLPPFQGGAAGLFGYDLGRTLETIPDKAVDNPDMPDMAIGIYDQVLAFDHLLDKAWIITHAKNELEAHMKQAVLMNNLGTHPQQNHLYSSPLQWQAQFKPAEFKARIEKVKKHILQGDIFQANLAQKFEAVLPKMFSPYAHYQILRQTNAAPFAGFMNLGAVAIASSSPERFIHCDAYGHVSSKPIKGTIKRGDTNAKDKRQIERLLHSGKDKAENIMITDLLRNDLSRTCEADSINVPHLCRIESFARVHHLVTTITGTLKSGISRIDLLKNCFPGGSITGAPKIRAMEVIEELEPERRGAYCGSIGYIGFNGEMDSNILIRSLVYEGGRVSFHVGGGITALSDVDEEYEETLAKARAIFDSFEDTETMNYKRAG